MVSMCQEHYTSGAVSREHTLQNKGLAYTGLFSPGGGPFPSHVRMASAPWGLSKQARELRVIPGSLDSSNTGTETT